MLFNSINFFIFLTAVYLVYRLLPHRPQNILLLIASYFFYSCWDIRFLLLIVLSTVVDFTCGRIIHNGVMRRRERAIASLWAVLSTFFFVVVQWKCVDLKAQGHFVALKESLTWKAGWLIFLGICIVVITANLLYPLVGRLDNDRRRSIFLAISVIVNLSILGFFKYFNFFIENMETLIQSLNLNPANFRLNIILPVGISFYTFQTMSYTIDIYRRKLKPTDNFLDFALFVGYFPQLVAGPIERAVNLLPKICARRNITIDQIIRGLHLIFYGLFKKVVIADGVAGTVNQIYGSTGQISWIEVVTGTVLFAIQIYCDFSGYSDIARGTSKLFGIDLMINFNLPYFSQNPREFWSRWHISLSTWLRDYLYIPLGGNRKGTNKTYRNIIITMLLGGLWHGAAWNFVIWGLYHGLILCIHKAIISIRKIDEIPSNILIIGVKIVFFFMITLYGWLLFRAPSFAKIMTLSSTLFFDFGNLDFSASLPRAAAIFGLPIFMFIESMGYFMKGESFHKRLPVPIWTATYASMLFCLAMGMNTQSSQFIYFQF